MTGMTRTLVSVWSAATLAVISSCGTPSLMSGKANPKPCTLRIASRESAVEALIDFGHFQDMLKSADLRARTA